MTCYFDQLVSETSKTKLFERLIRLKGLSEYGYAALNNTDIKFLKMEVQIKSLNIIDNISKLKQEVSDFKKNAPEILKTATLNDFSEDWSRTYSKSKFVKTTWMIAIGSLVVNFLAMTLVTGNIIFTMITLVSNLISIISFISIMYIKDQRIGMVETVSMIAVVALSFDYTLIMTLAFKRSTQNESL